MCALKSCIICVRLVFKGAIAVTSGLFSETSLPIVIGEVFCSGNESSLLQCPYRDGLDSSCGSSEDAAIVCQGDLS